ncbi:MAG TPA: hypothetical protein VGP06_09430 [Janthinobacterium sp.]|nr:hypothetical protein [Janthinobacterium sp.]
MSLFPAIGSRHAQTPSLSSATQQADTQSAGKQLATGNPPTGTSAGNTSTGTTPVSLSQSGIDLSMQGLQNQANELGNQTVDFAQNFVNSVTQSLFGNAAQGATISFDSASLETEAGFAAGVQQTQGPNGSTNSAALSLNESSHFIGKGTITTADGQSYQFQVEVQYSASAEVDASTSSPASASSASSTDGSGANTATSAATSAATSGNAGAGGTDLSSLPTLQLPPINFPGSLTDLFSMLGHPMQTTLPANTQAAADGGNANGSGQGGTLSLRLLNLIQQTTTLGTTGTTDTPATSTPSAAKAYAIQAPAAPAQTVPATSADPDLAKTNPPAA